LLKLRQIYNHVLAVSNLETDFDKLIVEENERRRSLEKELEKLEEASMFGMDAEAEQAERMAQKKFRIALTKVKVTLMMNADGYRVSQFFFSILSHKILTKNLI
jgi:hypothetical protein